MDIISDAKLREDTATNLQAVITYAENAIGFLTMGDDKGATYALKKAEAHFRAVIDRMADLVKRNSHRAKEEAYALAKPAVRSVRYEETHRPNGADAGGGGKPRIILGSFD